MNIQRLLQLVETVQDPMQRKSYLEVMLAIELGYHIALPSEKVDSIVAHLEQFHAPVVKRVIGEINELYPFNVTSTYNLVVDVYRQRYLICHCPGQLNASAITSMLEGAQFKEALMPRHLDALKCGSYDQVVRNELREFVNRFFTASA